VALISFPGRSQPRSVTPDLRTVSIQERILTIQKVSVLSEESSGGKSRFSVLLETDLESELSSRPRRTVEISSLYLGVEEKEVPLWTRLAGRELGILLEKSVSAVQMEDLVLENQELRSEVDRLRRKNRGLTENFHQLIENTREVS